MYPESPSESERLARAIDETKRLLDESERILQEASGAFVRRASALISQGPGERARESDVGEIGS